MADASKPEFLSAHPWIYAGVGSGALFLLSLGWWPLPAAAVVALAAFGVIGWSWSRGPSRRAYDEQQQARKAGEISGNPNMLVLYGAVALPLAIFMVVYGIADGIAAITVVGALGIVAGVGSLVWWRRTTTGGPSA